MNWGKGIVLSFILFASFIGILVFVCVRQDISLVSKSYYADELGYNQKMEKISNASNLPNAPKIFLSNDSLVVVYDRLSECKDLKIKLFRPSDEKLDQLFSVPQVDGNTIKFKLGVTKIGHYKVQFFWAMKSKLYYLEDTVFR